MIEYPQLAGIIVSLFSSYITWLDKVILRKLKKLSATEIKKACSFNNSGKLKGWCLNRLTRSGTITKTKTGSYYFDSVLFSSNRYKRRIRAMVLIIILVTLILSLLIFT